MGKKSEKPKNKRRIDEKIEIIMKAIHNDHRVLQLVNRDGVAARNGRIYTMSEIARISGYARSSRFMLTLYEMCDRGYLKKTEYNSYTSGRGKGITDVNIYFSLPDYDPRTFMSDMFTEVQ